jgi:glyoxylase I family protein
METTGIHHVALNVRDLDEALAFYIDRLELTLLDRPDFGFAGAWVQAGASQIHLMETAEATIDRRQHLALQVRDLDEVLAGLEAAGVEVARVPYLPGAGRQAFLRDPSGNRIELNQPDQN